MHITKSEGSGVGFGISVFARAEEEKEGNDDHVAMGSQTSGICRQVLCNVSNAMNDRDWDGFHTVGGQVFFLPSCKHSPNAKISFKS